MQKLFRNYDKAHVIWTSGFIAVLPFIPSDGSISANYIHFAVLEQWILLHLSSHIPFKYTTIIKV